MAAYFWAIACIGFPISVFAEGAEIVDAEWPKHSDGTLKPCPYVSVLQDTAQGWPGSCLDLKPITNSTTNSEVDCRNRCTSDATCSVWQWTKDEACWVGVVGFAGGQCWGRDGDDDFRPKAAQRLQQGQVTVIKNYTQEWVTGLFHVGIYAQGTANDDHARCRNECYSDIGCRYWLWGSDGCWLERPPTFVVGDDPVIQNASDHAKTLVTGQHIQHKCMPVAQAPAKKESSNMLVLGAIGGVIFGVLFLMVCMGACAGDKPKSKKTRAVKLNPAKVEDPPAAQPLVQPPTYTSYTVQQMPAPSPSTYQMVSTYQPSAQPSPPVVLPATSPTPVESPTLITPPAQPRVVETRSVATGGSMAIGMGGSMAIGPGGSVGIGGGGSVAIGGGGVPGGGSLAIGGGSLRQTAGGSITMARG